MAIPLRQISARVAVSTASTFHVVPSDAETLVSATTRSLERLYEAAIPPIRIEVSTSIPRSVGLAGSSAIIIATLRALIGADRDAEWSRLLAHDRDALAQLALVAETEDLGLVAGLQDRLVQSYDQPVVMDFETNTTRRLDNLPGHYFVAYNTKNAASSDVVHGDLRTDYNDDVGETRSTVAAIAQAGRDAAAAIEAHDIDALMSAMNLTLERRGELLTLDPTMLAASAAVQRVGGAANWTGSGGAIVVLLRDDTNVAELQRVLTAEYSCGIVKI